ncbi:perlucin-like protein [Crassostrea virginica]
MKTLRLAPLLLFMTVQQSLSRMSNEDSGRRGCEKGWIKREGRCYLFSRNRRSFPDGVNFCTENGGSLLEVENKEEENWVNFQCLIRGYSGGVWIGIVDISHNGTFLAVSTQNQPSYKNWAPGEPSRHLNQEHCGFIWVHTNQWNDAGCGRPEHIVCKQ